jgi:hypothetical protein
MMIVSALVLLVENHPQRDSMVGWKGPRGKQQRTLGTLRPFFLGNLLKGMPNAGFATPVAA